MRCVGYLFFSIHTQPLAQYFIQRFGFALKLISLSDKTAALTRKAATSATSPDAPRRIEQAHRAGGRVCARGIRPRAVGRSERGVQSLTLQETQGLRPRTVGKAARIALRAQGQSALLNLCSPHKEIMPCLRFPQRVFCLWVPM
jgi:hypothetical protein